MINATPLHTGEPMLHGRTVMVAGAAGSGVAAGLRAAISAAGARLVLVDRDAQALAKVVAAYPDSLALDADISLEREVVDLFRRLADEGVSIDGLVNNASIGLNKIFSEATSDEFDHVLGIGLRGTWLVAKEFAKQAEDGAAIVNISSVHARASQYGYALYASAKAAVEGLTRGIALDLGPLGIRCNAVAPGLVDAAQNADLLATVTDDPLLYLQRHTAEHQAIPRIIDSLDVGWAVTFLLSKLARSITGQTLAVDAGISVMLYDRVWAGDSRTMG